MSTSLLTPFQIIGGKIAATTDPTTQVEQKIITTLLTDKLERIGIPDFGAGISQMVFEPMDDLITADIKVDAMSEISARISGVKLISMSIVAQQDSTAMVNVIYQLPLSAIQQVTFEVALPGSLTEESDL